MLTRTVRVVSGLDTGSSPYRLFSASWPSFLTDSSEAQRAPPLWLLPRWVVPLICTWLCFNSFKDHAQRQVVGNLQGPGGAAGDSLAPCESNLLALHYHKEQALLSTSPIQPSPSAERPLTPESPVLDVILMTRVAVRQESSQRSPGRMRGPAACSPLPRDVVGHQSEGGRG